MQSWMMQPRARPSKRPACDLQPPVRVHDHNACQRRAREHRPTLHRSGLHGERFERERGCHDRHGERLGGTCCVWQCLLQEEGRRQRIHVLVDGIQRSRSERHQFDGINGRHFWCWVQFLVTAVPRGLRAPFTRQQYSPATLMQRHIAC